MTSMQTPAAAPAIPRARRRQLLAMLGAGGLAALLGACTISKGGGTTSATIDVKRIVTDSSAIIAAVTAALTAPALIAALGPAKVVVVEAALTAANGALAAIEQLTGGTVVLAVDTSRLQALVTSLLADAQTALTIVQGVVSGLTGAVATQVANYISAALSLIPFVQLAAELSSSFSHSIATMDEDRAIAVAYGVPG